MALTLKLYTINIENIKIKTRLIHGNSYKYLRGL